MNSSPLLEASVAVETAEQKRAALMTQARAALAKVFEVPNLSEAQRLMHAKSINAALAKLEYQSGESHLTSRPSMIDLPVAGKCNLRCTMCGLSHGSPTYPNWTLAEVERFEPLLRYARSVNPTGAGEPLTNRDFFPILELFTSYGLISGFYTNAMLLTRERSEKLIRLGIQQVNISIDGATAETFERIRHHAKFATVVGNARQFVEERRKLGAGKPNLQIAMVLMRENLHELPDLVRLAADIGAASVYTMFVSGIVPEKMCELEPARTNAALREARRVAEELHISIMCPEYLAETAPAEALVSTPSATSQPAARHRGVICSHPWYQFTVWNDGLVSPCCFIRDDVDGEKFGNIHDSEPEALWNSPGLVRLRERLAAGNPPHTCAVCPMRTAAIH